MSCGMFDCLPDEVLAGKILLRLPVKSVLKCSCVCRSWRSLITNPNFISTHPFHHSEDLQKIFVTQINIVTNCKLFLFNNLAEDHFSPPMSLHLPPCLDSGTTRFKILGSVNGLICISGYEPSIRRIVTLILFNPSIGRFLSIPPPPSTPSWSIQAFGFDETTQDYKILLIQRGDIAAAFVYSLNLNSWRCLPVSPPRLFHSGLTVFINGAIHWVDSTPPTPPTHFFKQRIIAFDLKAETFRQVPLPQCLVRTHRASRLIEFGASLVIAEQTLDCMTHVWVMKEYGLVESWIKLTILDFPSVVLGSRNNDQVLIRLLENYIVGKSGCIVSQSIHNNSEVQNLMDMVEDDRGYLYSYVYKYLPSLVLLDKQNNVDATFVYATPSPKRAVEQHQLELRRSKRLRKTAA